MAYRRLPNTDKARIEVIDALLTQMCNNTHVEVITVHQTKVIKQSKTYFVKLIAQRKKLTESRIVINKYKKAHLQQLKLCISHFIQVLNFAIIRNEVSKSCRSYFGLSVNAGGIPLLLSEDDIVSWAQTLIVGEAKRTMGGAITISHPRISTIEKLLEETINIQQKLKGIKLEYEQLKDTIQLERNKLDEYIKKAWNDIEFYFREETTLIKRKKTAQYGIIYVDN